GERSLLDEEGNEAMEWVQESDEYRLANVTNLQKYKEAQPIDLDVEMNEQELQQKINAIKEKQNAEANSTESYTDQEKSLFYYYVKFKLMKPTPAGRLAGINERTVQDWGRKLKNDSEWDIYEKKANKSKLNKSQLGDEQKENLKEFYDNNPFATIPEAIDHLTKPLEGFSLKSTHDKKKAHKTHEKRMKSALF
ncbi:hypothetical protein K501DRAFT_196646, partial [Backusella circina FSU 941]